MANYVPSTPADVGAEAAGSVAAHNISGTAHADLRPVYYSPATMTVNAGTLNAGTVSDLGEVGGTDVSIQELNGSNPLTVTFGFTGVTRLSSIEMYLDYIGGAGHVINVEIYNVNTTNWDILGSFSTTEMKVWRSYQIFMPNQYLNAGAVQCRLRHTMTGVNSHQFIIDYLDINDGGTGGIGYIGDTSVAFTPTGTIAATNVQAALSELDTEKAPMFYYTTLATWEALTPEQQATIKSTYLDVRITEN